MSEHWEPDLAEGRPRMQKMARSLYIAAYDIGDENRLRLVLKVVRSYASGGQKSVHECWLEKAEVTALLSAVREAIDLGIDSFALIPLDPRRGVSTLGCAVPPSDPDYYYFG
jgi:CRISPR-associated protein Cas2